jgi:tRNA G18 (ribose-2'-O)-methylase SpoU
MNIFLHAPEDFKNLCVMSRTFECFGITKCHVYDPHHLLRTRYGKSYSHRIRTVSAGAFFNIRWEVIADPREFIASFPGRHICTVPDGKALSVYQYPYDPSDLIVFGSERRGIPDDIQQLCDERVTIPIVGNTQSLNLSISMSIIIAEIFRQNKMMIQ